MSKVVAIEIKDFMSIGEARLEYDDSGILNITGYNDSGKSAITRSLEVLFYDTYSSEQVNYVRDNCEFFGVGAEFDDGISINKYKYANGKSVWEMLKGDEVIFTNRLKDGIAAMGDIPEPIAKYLGVIKDESTSEQLNIRRNTDKLFLINTTGGDNYKILNAVLRADILAESVKRMNEDRNKLQSEVTNLATSSTTLKRELETINVLDDNLFTNVSNITEKLRVTKGRVEYLTSIGNQKDILNSYTVYDELPVVDTSRLNEISNLQSLKTNTEIVIFDECITVDTYRHALLSDIIQNRKGLDVVIPVEVGSVDTRRLSDLQVIGDDFNRLWNATNSLASTELEHTKVLAELKQLSEIHGFKICKVCGTVAS